MTRWTEHGFVAVDWGSSARRAYRLDADGTVVDAVEDTAGTLATPRERFPAAVAALRQRFGGLPLLLAGMVGSNRGWIEAPYVPAPATLRELAGAVLWSEPSRTAIVPGVALIEDGRADVMRGEEVQVFGLAALEPGLTAADICHPGTHTKWIALRGGRLTGFRTVMTGELFAVLREHSILAELLRGEATPGKAFAAGVERGLGGATIAAELFGLRAGALLGVGEPGEAPSFASGLLIGSDLRSGLAGCDPAGEIVVMGRDSLTRLYAAALAQSGYRTREVDGAQAFVAGMRALAKELE